MHRNQAVARFIRTLTVLATMSAVLFASIQPALAADAIIDTAADSSNESADGDNLLQCTSDGHVLGFGGDNVIIASANRMLEIEFLNAGTVAPETAPAVSGQEGAGLDRVTYPDLWDGVTVVYEASEGAILKSTYYVSATEAEVSVDRIRLGYNRPLSIDEYGNLVIAYEDGIMVESAPIAWQEIDGERMPVAAAYALYGEREVGFALGDYLPGIPVVIDPSLAWHTFLGSSVYDWCFAIAVDGRGNVYVGGHSESTWGSPVRAYAGSYDAFAAKLDSSGNLVWNTFLGGSGDDQGNAIAVDGSGNVYVGGASKADWGSAVRAYAGQEDAFAVKLDSGDGTLVWNTFLGGSGYDQGNAIAVDGIGNVYVSGVSSATWGDSPVRKYTTGSDDFADAFAAKLNSDGTLTWNTFLGGSLDDCGNGVAVDGSGNVYVSGDSQAYWGSSPEPVRPHAEGEEDEEEDNKDDAFAAKLDSSGNLAWHTFLGGSGYDEGNAIAVDGTGNVYVSGASEADWGSAVRAYAGQDDAFAAKLDANGTLVWNTFLGGSSYDKGRAIAVDGSGNVYVGGYSWTTWGSPVLDLDHTALYDAFAARLDSSGNLGWNAFLGGSQWDYCEGIAVDDFGSVYVGGWSEAGWGSPVRDYTAGTNDAFAAKLAPVPPPHAAFSATPTRGTAPLTVRFANESTGGVSPCSYQWDFGDGATSADENATHTYRKAGSYLVTLAVTDSGNDTDSAQASIIVQAAQEVKDADNPPAPASFIASYLSVASEVVLPNQSVEVSLNVCNNGGEKGSRSVTLEINGHSEQSQVVGVSPGSCKTVVFRVSKAVPGTYQVSVEGMQGQFTVLAPRIVQASVPSQQDTGLGTAGIIAIAVMALALIAALIFVFKQS